MIEINCNKSAAFLLMQWKRLIGGERRAPGRVTDSTLFGLREEDYGLETCQFCDGYRIKKTRCTRVNIFSR